MGALQMRIELIEAQMSGLSYYLALHLADTEDRNFKCCQSFNFHPLPFRSDEAVTEAVTYLHKVLEGEFAAS